MSGDSRPLLEQDSGSCARKSVGVRVPPFAPLLLSVALLLLLSACPGRSQADRFLDRSLVLLDGVIEILEEHPGDQDKAEEALRAYVAKHRAEVRALRVDGKAAFAKLEGGKKKDFEERAKKERLERETRIRNLAATFDRPKNILGIARLVD
jgi:hypothetical protein